MTAKIFLKLIFGVLGVLAVALTTVDVLASRLARDSYVRSLTQELSVMLSLLSPEGFEQMNPKMFQTLAHAARGRLTYIAKDGRVIADSEADASHMENHGHRPEVAAALEGRPGRDTRTSNTIGVDFLYVAAPTSSGALRIAVPLKEIDAQVNAMRKQLLISVAVAFIPAILVAGFFARYVSSRLAAIIDYAGKLARGDFRARLPFKARDELGLLSVQLNETGEKLQKMFEEQQREHEQLERMERIRKDFVINVSHELRTPLASIQGYTETLLDGALNDPDHNIRFLTIIRQNAERLGRLTADLMTLSRLEQKATKFQFASYYVSDLVADCVDSMRPMAEKKRIEIELRPMPGKAEVFCDSEAVHQVIMNLLDNALKYTPEGGKITVGTSEVLTPTEMVQISVSDTGIGIPKEDLPRLFERFYRVDKARSRELGGTGLGLAIVKHLVRAMGGDVRVDSELNKGSTFLFTLPVHDLGLLEHGAVQPELTVL
jgi:two-component system phosphate regulon sensor histidine kinase PhoR